MKASEYFNNGYSCSESIVKWAIDEGFASENLLAVATPFSGGIGVGCLCGAVAGAQLVIGEQFGRENKYGNDAIARVKAKEFMQKFMEKYKVTCCKILTRNLEMASSERKSHCTNMVEECEILLKSLLKSEKSSILK